MDKTNPGSQPKPSVASSAGRQPDNKPNKKIIFGLSAVFILILLAQFFFNRSKSEELKTELQEKEIEVSSTLAKMDSLELEIDQRIQAIEELGGDVEELQKVKEELEAERDQLKKQTNIAWSSYRRVQEKVEGYETILKTKDEEIAKLKAVNEELFTENTTLKTEKNQLNDSISGLQQEKENLAGKVAVASQLKAENIQIMAVNQKGKKRDSPFRVKQINDLEVSFNLAENNVAAMSEKVIMIRITDPDGNVIFDVASGSGTFMFDGKEEFFTAQQEILFDNTRQRLTFLYNKGSEYARGKHTVEIYAEDYYIGQSDFLVK